MEFIVPLREKKLRFSSGLALHLIAAVCLLFAGLVSAAFGTYLGLWPATGLKRPMVILAVVSILLAILIAILAVKSRKAVQQGRSDLGLTILEALSLFGAALLCYKTTLRMPAYCLGALGAIVLVAAFIRRKSTGPAGKALIREKGVLLDRRDFPWKDIERVLIRKGNLTLEATRNRLFQRELLPGEYDAEAIEAYSRAMVERAMPDREKEW